MAVIHSVLQSVKEFVSANSKILIFGSVGIATAAAFAIWYNNQVKIPQKWRRVGELSDLMCFPIKSCGVIRENQMECTLLGLRKGKLRDRVFMIIDLNGKFVTARQYPRLVKVSPMIEENMLTLSAPGMMDHVIDIDSLHKKSTIKTNVWGERVETVDCGEEVAKWFSRFILSEDTGFRLVYYPASKPQRDVSFKKKAFEKLQQNDSGALPDCTSFMMISESSVADLNTRLEEPVIPQLFRPNFVVKGSEMYDEDNWDWVKIGKDAIFRCVMPCTRCVLTTIDPETGIKNKKNEPLATLKTYRQITDSKYRPTVGESPAMGIHLGIRVPGKSMCYIEGRVQGLEDITRHTVPMEKIGSLVTCLQSITTSMAAGHNEPRRRI